MKEIKKEHLMPRETDKDHDIQQLKDEKPIKVIVPKKEK